MNCRENNEALKKFSMDKPIKIMVHYYRNRRSEDINRSSSQRSEI
jgi:hypothetical protein